MIRRYGVSLRALVVCAFAATLFGGSASAQDADVSSLRLLAELSSRREYREDPADSLYRLGQAALRRSEHQRAVELFRAVRTRHASSALAGDAGYWEAFALSRIGGQTRLAEAREVLAWAKSNHPSASSAADARALAARIEGQLASGGDSESAQRITERARTMAQTCPREDEDERLMVLDALLTMDRERALPTLKSVLARRDECSAVLRRKAVFLVSRKQSAETEDILLNALRNDPDKEVREQAVFWLGQVNTEKSTTALLDLLRTSKDAMVLERVVFSLSQQRNDRAGNALRELIRRTDVPIEVRGNAIFFLGNQRGDAVESMRFLTELYPTLSEPVLKERVLWAVSQRRTPEAQRFLTALALNASEPMQVRRTAIFQASQAGMTVAQLRELYRSVPDKEIREQVIFAISNAKNTEAVDALFDIAKNDPDREMRQRAIFWLGSSKDPRVPEFLREILEKRGE
jgi:HEAT repeat protein